MIICLGPVCVPVHLLLSFLVAIAHRYGYLKWVKTEWVTYRYWKHKVYRLIGWEAKTPAGPSSGPEQVDTVEKSDTGPSTSKKEGKGPAACAEEEQLADKAVSADKPNATKAPSNGHDHAPGDACSHCALAQTLPRHRAVSASKKSGS